jgi:hypothetical protein
MLQNIILSCQTLVTCNKYEASSYQVHVHVTYTISMYIPCLLVTYAVLPYFLSCYKTLFYLDLPCMTLVTCDETGASSYQVHVTYTVFKLHTLIIT